MKKDIIKKYISKKYNEYSYVNINRLIRNNKLDLYDFIRIIFNIINDTEFSENPDFVFKCVDLITNVYNPNKIYEKDNEKIQKSIKKLRNRLLDYLDSSDNVYLSNAFDALEKYTDNDDALVIIIKKLIDKNEDVTLIKNVINIDRAQVKKFNNILFEYIFKKELNVIDSNSYLNNYYIALLKLFYFNGIDKTRYIKALDKHNTQYTAEIYNIIYGNNLYLSLDEILTKYDKNIEHNDDYINIFTKPNLCEKIFTIDPINSILKDDAISIKKDGTNYIIKVYIVDVPSYINVNSDQNICALELYKNSYMREGGINIYSDNTSSKLSLLESSIRKSITLNLVFDNSYTLKDYYLTNDVITIDRNFSFYEADEILKYNKIDLFSTDIRQLNEIINTFNNKGSNYLLYKEAKNPNKIIYQYESTKIISELNRLYNSIIPIIMSSLDYRYIYRAQDKPYLNDIYNSIESIMDETLESKLNIYMIPYYTLSVSTHYGQGNILYSHITSPLRRYVDSYNQRLLHKYYFKDIDFDDNNIEKIIRYFNIRDKEIKLFEEDYNKKSYELTKKKN